MEDKVINNFKASDLIKQLNLTPHPEGGYFREIYRADEKIPGSALPNRYGADRHFSTSIYFLLTHEAPSLFHQIKSDENLYFHFGSLLTVHMFCPDGSYQRVRLGLAKTGESRFQLSIPRGTMFASEVESPDGFTLIGCNVAPGFEFEDFAMGERSELVEKYPEQRALIERLTP